MRGRNTQSTKAPRRGALLTALTTICVAVAVPAVFAVNQSAVAASVPVAVHATVAGGPVSASSIGVAVRPDGPARFDPQTASNDDLIRYGYPPRPRAGVDQTGWRAYVEQMHRMQRVTNLGFRVRYDHPGHSAPATHASGKRQRPQDASSSFTADSSANWAGYQDGVANVTYGYSYAEMHWKVLQPQVIPNYSANVFSSIWPGIGQGVNHNDQLVQNGTEQDLNYTSRAITLYFWFEACCYQDPYQYEITNYAPHLYDQVWTTVSVLSPTSILYTWTDTTQNKAFSVNETLNKSGAQAIGATADFILERTTESGSLPALPDFATESLTGDYAAVGSGAVTCYTGEAVYGGEKWTMHSTQHSPVVNIATPSAPQSGCAFTVTRTNPNDT